MEEIVSIQSKIFVVRGQKVMLDRDLAQMYGIETKVLNQAVKRNLERFPSDFMFQMTSEETENWKSQIVTTNSIKMGMRRNPYVFTELGVAMLSSVLNSKTAIQVNIGIMRAFVTMRNSLSGSLPSLGLQGMQKQIDELRQYVEDILTDQNDINESTGVQLELINQALAELQAEKTSVQGNRKRIGFISYDRE